jgi:hypothetical protein
MSRSRRISSRFTRVVAAVALLAGAGVAARATSSGASLTSVREATPLTSERFENCPAVQRWDVKTLADTKRNSVHYGNIEHITIDGLRALTDIGAQIHTPRTGPDESRVFQVRARMVEAKIEGDGDIHLVLRDNKHTIIVELPDPTCAFSAKSKKVAEMKAARKAFEDACGTPGHSDFTPLTGSATIVGVGFFDVPHTGTGKQHGVAKNNIELHPVLSFTKPTCPHP